MKLQWKNIEEGIYTISEYGDIKIAISGRNRKKGMLVKTYLIPSGYLRVDLTVDSKQKHFKIHRLVARAFIGPCPEGYQVNHKDGIKTNNHYSNLEYVTPLENIKHAMKMGLCTFQVGENHRNAKLTNENVRWIKKQLRKPSYKDGNKNRTHKRIARKFNVSQSAIQQLAHGRSWKKIY